MALDLRDREYELLARFVSALERVAESYEVQVINQAKIVDQTVKTMQMATELDPIQGPTY